MLTRGMVGAKIGPKIDDIIFEWSLIRELYQRDFKTFDMIYLFLMPADWIC